MGFWELLKNIFRTIPIINDWIEKISAAWENYQAEKANKDRQKAADDATKSKDTSGLEDLLNGKK